MAEFDPAGDLPYHKAMLAGAAAGVSEHVAMYPIDTIKTRLQIEASGSTRYRNIAHAIVKIAREEGFLRFYRGVSATAGGAIPSHMAQFATYELMRDALGAKEAGHHPIKNAIAGGCAIMAHDAIITPLDVVKQRLQMFNSQYRGVFDAARTISKQEGIRAFFASYPTTVLMNVPFMSVQFATYEFLKLHLTKPGRTHGPQQEFLAGGGAGALGGLVSTPLDVIKTRLQTSPHMTATRIVKDLYKSEGFMGFTRGATARVLIQVPSAAVCWTTYESMKKLLKGESLSDLFKGG